MQAVFWALAKRTNTNTLTAEAKLRGPRIVFLHAIGDARWAENKKNVRQITTKITQIHTKKKKKIYYFFPPAKLGRASSFKRVVVLFFLVLQLKLALRHFHLCGADGGALGQAGQLTWTTIRRKTCHKKCSQRKGGLSSGGPLSTDPTIPFCRYFLFVS